MDKKEILFPYDRFREIQKDMISKIVSALDNKKNLIIHAPTGLGKTVAVMSPGLALALKNDLNVIFLTSRHTQHRLAVDTLKDIRNKYSVRFSAADMIGRKWMCIQGETEQLFSREFADYCRAMVESGKCEYYQNTRKGNKLSPGAKKTLEELKNKALQPERWTFKRPPAC